MIIIFGPDHYMGGHDQRSLFQVTFIRRTKWLNFQKTMNG